MQDILSTLDALRRPPLLIRAARIGVGDYKRAVHLPRLLGHTVLPSTGAALMRLIEIEVRLEQGRVERAAGYRAARHVDVLIALMGEARLLRTTQPASA